jgi:hypothetical protein
MARKKNDFEGETEIIEEPMIEISSNATEDTKNIGFGLEKIRKLEGIIGYIFRNESGATIDLNEPDKIIDYAMLSTELTGCIGGVIEQIFDVGSVECILAEGDNVKVLCIANGVNRISVFMSKSANHEDVKQKLAQALLLYQTK